MNKGLIFRVYEPHNESNYPSSFIFFVSIYKKLKKKLCNEIKVLSYFEILIRLYSYYTDSHRKILYTKTQTYEYTNR
jgi:hypothetical protein